MRGGTSQDIGVPNIGVPFLGGSLYGGILFFLGINGCYPPILGNTQKGFGVNKGAELGIRVNPKPSTLNPKP